MQVGLAVVAARFGTTGSAEHLTTVSIFPLSSPGYSPIKLACSDDAFGGLEHNEGGQSLLDGSIGSTEWYYAVGDYGTSTWGQDGIPACSSLPPQMMAELYVTTP